MRVKFCLLGIPPHLLARHPCDSVSLNPSTHGHWFLVQTLDPVFSEAPCSVPFALVLATQVGPLPLFSWEQRGRSRDRIAGGSHPPTATLIYLSSLPWLGQK